MQDQNIYQLWISGYIQTENIKVLVTRVAPLLPDCSSKFTRKRKYVESFLKYGLNF